MIAVEKMRIFRVGTDIEIRHRMNSRQPTTKTSTTATSPLRVLVCDEHQARSELLERSLSAAGYVVIEILADALQLQARVLTLQPDVVIIGVESPDRDTLEHFCSVCREQPLPVVMFSSNGDRKCIQEVVRAGVSAYVVDGLSAERVAAVVEVAIVRFQENQALRHQLDRAKSDLAERKTIDRAKGLLMRQRNMSEEQAYAAMRKLAMDQNKRIADVAQNILAVTELFDKA